MELVRVFFQRKYFIFSAFLMMVILMLGTIFALVVASSWLNSCEGIVHSPDSHYDYIIVGAGTAGCVLASQLVHDISKPSVLVIEAGEYFPWWSSIPMAAPLLQETSYDWTYHTVPQIYSSWGLNNETSTWPRGRGLGGSGQINYMIHFAGAERDFKKWEELGVEGWSYRKMQSIMNNLLLTTKEKKYLPNTDSCSNNYKSVFNAITNDTCKKKSQNKAHKFSHSKLYVSPPNREMSTLVSAFVEGGQLLQQSGQNSSLFLPIYSSIKDGQRWSTFDGFLRPVLSKKNLHVLLKSVVSKVLFSEKNRAIGIEIIKTANHTVHIYSRKEIILCAGSINTPKILLLSGIGPSQHLQQLEVSVIKDLPVGLGLHDHLNIPLYVSIERSASVTVNKVFKISEILQYLISGKGYLASSGIVGVGSTSSNLGIVLFGLGSINENLLRRVANYKQNTFKALFPFSQNTSHEGFVLLASCLQPLSRGFITLQSKNPFQPPLIDPQYLSQRQDVVCMSEAVKLAVHLIKTQPFQALGAQLNLPHLEECKHVTPNFEDDVYIECLLRTAAITGYHPAGTCKMGKPTDRTTVVDSFFRVHGISGLRIVDGSVIPTPISGHPNSIIIALAKGAASLILNSSELEV